jgi:hypothetical protein
MPFLLAVATHVPTLLRLHDRVAAVNGNHLRRPAAQMLNTQPAAAIIERAPGGRLRA